MERAVRPDLSVLGRGRLVGLPVLWSQRHPIFRLETNTLSLLAASARTHCSPKVLYFYAGFCAHQATCLKADGKDIKVLNLILSGDSDGVSNCT